MIKKDHYIFGILTGIIFPAAIYGLIFIMNLFLIETGIAKFYLDMETHLLISLGSNSVPIRYYFVNLKYDKTGRGILLITFATILFFFAFKDKFLL